MRAEKRTLDRIREYAERETLNSVKLAQREDTPRVRRVAAVAQLAGVCYRKVLRYLDEGLATEETARRVNRVLHDYGVDIRRPPGGPNPGV